MKQYTCWCYECLKDMKEDGWPISMTRMILCPDCGNKRCPKATDHNNPCTNSNEPNQEGSRYSNNFYKKQDMSIGSYYNPDNYNSFNFDSMAIKQVAEYDPIVVKDMNHKEIFRINQDGDIFWNGRQIKGDEELVKATTEFMKRMTECMIKTN